MLDKQTLLDNIIDYHRSMFQVSRREDDPLFAAEAIYSSRSPQSIKSEPGGRYLPVSNEFAYFALTERLDQDELDTLAERAFSDAVSRNQVRFRHKQTDVTLVIAADSITSGAMQALVGLKKKLSYKWGIWGFIELRVYAIDCEQARSFANKWGNSLKKYLDKKLYLS